MFEVGGTYETLAGKMVKIVGVANKGNSYETVFSMENEKPVHRYNTRDFGRVTGSSHDPKTPDPRNLKPLPAPDSFETVACLWEAFLKTYLDNMGRNGGAAEARQKVIELHEACDRWYNYAKALGFDSCFDWEWCPWFMDQCIDGDGMICLKNEEGLKAAVEEFCT